jgi:vancomycin resistance protein YoaR
MSSKKIFLISLLVFTSFTAAGLGVYGYEQYMRTLPPETFLGEVTLSGFTKPQALEAVDKSLRELAKKKYPIIIHENASKDFSSEELGIRYDSKKTVEKIFQRSGWFASAQKNDEPNMPSVHFDSQKLESSLKQYLFSPEKDFQNAEIVWNDKVWSIRAEVPGLVLKEGEWERVRDFIQQEAEKKTTTEPILVAYEPVEAMDKTPDLEPLLATITELTKTPMTLLFGPEKMTVRFEENKDWIIIDSVQKKLSFNEAFAKEWIEKYALERDVIPGEVLVTSIEERVSEYDGKTYKKAVYGGDFTHGKTINREKLFTDIQKIMTDPVVERAVVVEWQDLLPTIASQVEGYQFPQILSTGISSFRYGNHPNRVKNIKLSLESFQGTVINPGEEFSFNRITGWITPAKGYTKTQVIMEGKVEEGVGGGVCQSSTTMYRAFLNAGVQVTERRNHSLDIVYYHEYGYGLDASVYTDSRNDLKFINNFPGPILINTFTDDFKKEAYVEFYGTTDHRIVELSQLNTGNFLLKKWNWKIQWPDRAEEKIIQSIYQLPKEEEVVANPLEA